MMQLKLGDKVRFVNEPLEGIVTSIKDKIVGVTVNYLLMQGSLSLSVLTTLTENFNST
jgi:hypothetical protein